MERYLKLEITDVSYGGLGVGKAGGKVVFVPYTVTGDLVVAEIVQEKKNFSYARLVEIEQPSPWRVQAPCPYFGLCGGCYLEHVDYAYQLFVKHTQAKEIFRRIGGYEQVPVEQTLPSPRAWHYRGKMEFHCSLGKNGTVIGLRRARGHEIIEIEKCLIAHESINRALFEAKKRNLNGRVIFWADDHEGAPYIARYVKDCVFMVPREAFFQANLYLVEGLVDLVLEAGGVSDGETVLDAYCGVGLFTVFFARLAKKVVGIEWNRAAAEAARMNVEATSVSHCQIIPGEVGQVLGRLKGELKGGVDVMVVDPPRGGLSRNVLESIGQISPRKLIYVSCNPTTMARDGAFFSQAGYELTRLVPVDMFPQTPHIEVLGKWEKR